MNCQLSKAGQRFSLFVHWFGLMQKVSKSSAVADVVHIHLSANQLQRLSTESKRVRVRETPLSQKLITETKFVSTNICHRFQEQDGIIQIMKNIIMYL